MRKQFDILLSIKGNLEWITELYCDTVNEAITAAVELVGKAEYVGHKEFEILNGAWVEVAA